MPKGQPKTGKRQPKETKWDWAAIKNLYMSGAEISEIVLMPEYKGLSIAYVKNIMCKEGWAKQKQLVVTQASGMAEKNIVTTMKEQTEEHYKFMLGQITEERKQIEDRRKLSGTKDQRERLDLLESLEKIARRTLGLDQQEIGNKQAMSINAMISLHVTPPEKSSIVNDNRYVTTSHNLHEKVTRGEGKEVIEIEEGNVEEEREIQMV